MSTTHRIVIIGGGAGGLELATKLGEKLGRRGRASITLVDRSPTHVWKPLLHQVAAGTLEVGEHELEYLAQARWHHFRFLQGPLAGLDRARKQVLIGATHDEQGGEITPARTLPYDTLVICIGSQSNDFGTPGVKEHAIALDTRAEAERFHRRLINTFLRAHATSGGAAPARVDIAIIGAGATGVELAAELHYSMRQLTAYGLDNIVPDRDVGLTLIEAAPRILPALPERLSNATQKEVEKLNVHVLTGERVVRVSAAGVDTHSGKHVRAGLVVWAAGIKAPDVLHELDGLEVNRSNQLVVRANLQTTRDESIYAFGDCAACPWPGHANVVPPRAQAAHQQASLLVKSLTCRLRGAAPLDYTYRDFGSLVSLGEYSTVGSLMGAITRGSVMIEGLFARFMYVSLYKMHLLALHGFGKVILSTLSRMLAQRTEPQIKLH